MLSALLLGLSYPSYPYVRLEVLAWVWMVPVLPALRSVESLPKFLRNVFLMFLCVAVIGMSWLALSTLSGALLLFLFYPLIVSVPFVVFYFVRRTLGWRAALLSLPFVCTAWDWIYHGTEGSIGWFSIGVTQSNLYWLVQYADITGVWGITFWLALFNVLVVIAIEDWRARVGAAAAHPGRMKRTQVFLVRRLACVTGLMLLVPLTYAAYVFAGDRRAAKDEGKELDLMLVQPNINPWEKLTPDSRDVVLRKTIGLTNRALTASETKPDLIIYPESAVPYVLSESKDGREALYRAITRWQTPLLTGLLDVGDNDGGEREVFNAAALFSPLAEEAGKRLNVGRSATYHKRVLVPFVERVPYSDRFPALRSLALNIGAGDATGQGHKATVFTFRTRRGAEARIATAICYEYLYPAQVSELVAGGAQMLALITNEGWFSTTHGEYQLAAFSRLRSIETRRAVARVGNTGITQIVDALGRVRKDVPWWSEQTLRAKVRLSDEMSLYVRYPDYFPKACAWVALALLLAAVVRARDAVRSFHAPAGMRPGFGRSEDCLE
ncbi:MAG TPA: apolipoprotein N-acyltransferase [Pyrinomonadaceae bacterium]